MKKVQEDNHFIMKPKVDFCFKELMADAAVRRGFIAAFLGIRPEDIQVASFPLWPERSLFYLSKLFASGISEGEDYGVLRKCIHIGILDFELFPQVEEYCSCYHFWADHCRQMYTDKMEIHVLELPKLTRREYPESDLLDWARFLGADCFALRS